MPPPLVSICIVTYQHANFIAQTINGVLNQKTTFPIEILIGEDESSDGTREICQKLAADHPDRIQLFLRRRTDVIKIEGRETGRHNFIATLREAKGRYVALCDGDDYWTDPTKIERQVALLEKHPATAICFHETLTLSPDGSLKPICNFPDDIEFQRSDLITGNFIPSMSLMFRRPVDWDILADIGSAVTADWILNLQLAQFGDIRYINRPMAVYRQHEGGTWQSRPHEFKVSAIAKLENYVRSLLPSACHGLQELWRQKQKSTSWLENERDRWEGAANKAFQAYERDAITARQTDVDQIAELQGWVQKQEATIAQLNRDSAQILAQYNLSQASNHKLAAQTQEALTSVEKLRNREAELAELLNIALQELDGAAVKLKEYQAALRASDQTSFPARKESIDGFVGRSLIFLHTLRHLKTSWMGPLSTIEGEFYLDQALDDACTGTRIYNGWHFQPTVETAPLRTIHSTINGMTHVSPRVFERLDVAAGFPNEPGAQYSGFEFRLPIARGFNSFELQFLASDGWQTFRRDFTWGTASRHRSIALSLSRAKKPTIAFVIPCYNQGEYVADAVTSVLQQTWTDLEVVVINDGSTETAVATALSTIPPDPRLRIVNQVNQGLARTRNIGIESCSADWICCLDADDYVCPTYAEKCLTMLTLTGTDICGAWQQNFGEDDTLIKPGQFTTGDLWWENRMINAAIFSRKIWQRSGGYDPEMSVGYEDWDYWLRCANQGARATLVPEPLFRYRKHGPSMIDRAQARHGELVERVRRSHTGVRSKFTLIPPPVPASLSSLTSRFRPTESTQPTVLLVLPFLVLGGVDSLLCRLGALLTHRGFRFTVCSTDETSPEMGDSTSSFAAFTSDIHQLPAFLPHAAWTDYLSHLIVSRGIDTVWLAGSTFLYHNLPQLHRRHPHLRVFDQLFNTVGHTANHRRFAHHFERTLVENKEVYDWLVSAGEWPERIALIPNGVDTRDFSPAPEARKILSSRCRNKFIVGYFGRFSPEKGPDLLLDLIRKAAKESPDLHFVIGGAGPDLDMITTALNQPSLKNSTDYVGVVDTKKWLPACDGIVLPSRLDGRPNVVMEAMSCGVPVVAFDVGGVAEMVTDGETGYLVPAAKTDAMLERLIRLYQNPETKSRMGQRAREVALANFNLAPMIDRIADVLKSPQPESITDLISPSVAS